MFADVWGFACVWLFLPEPAVGAKLLAEPAMPDGILRQKERIKWVFKI
jgi:hypothetical protein